MRQHLDILFILSLVLGICLGGCNIFGTSPTLTLVESSNDSKAEDFIGPTWQLAEFQTSEGRDYTLEKLDNYTLQFQNDSDFVVTGACNEGGGFYQAQNGGVINISKLIVSEAGCYESETKYFRALHKVEAYNVSMNQLKLGYGEHGVLLYYRNR